MIYILLLPSRAIPSLYSARLLPKDLAQINSPLELYLAKKTSYDPLFTRSYVPTPGLKSAVKANSPAKYIFSSLSRIMFLPLSVLVG